MRQNPIHFIRCSILCLAGYAIYIPLAPVTVFGKEPESQATATPKIDHILLEVSDLNASIAFYRDFLGLRLKSQSDWFVMLESNNVGVFLRNSRWDWEKPHSNGLGRLYLRQRSLPVAKKRPLRELHALGFQ